MYSKAQSRDRNTIQVGFSGMINVIIHKIYLLKNHTCFYILEKVSVEFDNMASALKDRFGFFNTMFKIYSKDK